MTKLKGVILAALLLAACQTTNNIRSVPSNTRIVPLPNSMSESSPLTVLAYNIRVGFGSKYGGISPYDLAWGKGLPAVIEAIRAVDPDIVGLQEVAGLSQARAIAKALNLNYSYVWHDSTSTPWWGVALLSKFPILKSRSFQINSVGLTSREIVAATVSVGGTQIDFVSIHRVTDRQSLEGAQEIVDAVAELTNPVVLIGDFNLGPGDSRLEPVKEIFEDTAVAVDSPNSRQAISRGTFYFYPARIDYVFVQKGCFEVVDAGLLPEEHWPASDHIGYYAKLYWKLVPGVTPSKIHCEIFKEDPLAETKRLERLQQKSAKAWEVRLAQARCGVAEEQYWLGVMYKAGTEPAEEDPVTAYKWVSLAAKAGFRLAPRTKMRYAKSMTPAQLTEAKRMIAGWQPGSCKADKKTRL